MKEHIIEIDELRRKLQNSIAKLENDIELNYLLLQLTQTNTLMFFNQTIFN